MRTRFAPSPTGHLHLGHAFAALFAHNLARASGGSFLLRFEDIDTTRVRDDYYQAIEEDLRWLGIEWDTAPIRQSNRMPKYMNTLDTLKSLGVIYPCFCTRREIQKEIASISNAPHGPEGALYPGSCKKLTISQRDDRIKAGESHCWRLDSALAAEKTGRLIFHDAFQGEIEVDASLLGDVILARKDIATSYHLAVVVDDAFQKISDVTRGEDLLPSTHVHRILQELLEIPSTTYHHHPLILDTSGKRLAKRNDSLSIRTLRKNGASPADVLALIHSNIQPAP